ncbi:DUF2187 domain-containing protein [Bacillus cereus]|uniref:DUF2187 family protein n=1 Tax=Bacillus cereus TaxID=1396 RepID=UPI000BFB230B|nr:DUF2187 family protein [Bacillus cereus]PGU00828.1 DUF2187 domain-containing protein [Bacillus cereus]
MHARLGDVLAFQREKLTMQGKVLKQYNESVLVEIIHVEGGDFEYDKTIVNHKNYQIIAEGSYRSEEPSLTTF